MLGRGAGALAVIVTIWVGVTYTGQLRELPKSETKQVVAPAEAYALPEPPSSSPSVGESVPVADELPPKLATPASALRPAKPDVPLPARAKSAEAQKGGGNPGPEKRADAPPAEEVLIPSPASSQAGAKRDVPVLCAESNLFTRPMCIYRECQKPEYAGLQVCIDDKKRWEERDRARLQ
ncbi:MAG: hypothetical protein CFE44_02685 [Burkholderiales bacterium PBB4]|nr:MAG: hypothetical protein CFE44_02685 [Burkholderiales bacterium PBB4]